MSTHQDPPLAEAGPDLRRSMTALLVANLLPLFGVVALGWRAFDVVFLYWLENVVIGAINLLKILTCAGSYDGAAARASERIDRVADSLGVEHGDPAERAAKLEELAASSPLLTHSSKLFFAPFFTVHYGMFCLIHGVFVCVLLSDGGPMAGANPFDAGFEALGRFGIQVAALALTLSHLVSYFSNFLARGEYLRITPPELMAQPYARVVVLHVAIVLSGFLTVALGSPIWLLVLLVAGKTWLDLRLHLREHREAKGEPQA